MANKKILEMKGITKCFSGVIALNEVTFEAYAGEILALCGENGAGKSTLMKVLSGSYSNSEYDGEISVEGKVCKFHNTHQSEQAGIAMIYQEISMHLDATVAENLFMGRWHKKGKLIDWSAMYKEAEQYIQLVGLKVRPQEILRNLSASEQQLISIARALAKHPKILVLDEPTSPLTTTESENLFHILKELKEKGIASILITHKLDEVFQHADRITVLRDGQSVGSYLKSEATPEKVVADMVGRTITSFYPKEQVAIGEVVLDVKDITVPHPYTAHKNIVEQVSFNGRAGEIVGIAGLVGAGRSELVNALFGKIKKTSGTVWVEGKEVTIKKPIDAIKQGIALVTEDRKADGIVEVLSIRENTTLATLEAIAKGQVLQLKKEAEETKALYDKLNIKAPSIETLVQQLSGGNQQKVVLSKWLMRHPKILILDEPTRGIDVGAKYEIYKIMIDLAKKGVCIIMISSELSELLAMSDRIIVLASGRVGGELVAEGCTQEMVMEIATRKVNDQAANKEGA